jgi:hypothetical protein
LVAPPPLEEWLVGREILTVKQDGTAMFTKIQDALDALKPGQVVEVLDKGPYVESLNHSFSANTGLMSRVGTAVMVVGMNVNDGTEMKSGHLFKIVDEWRLSGFTFYADEENAGPETTVKVLSRGDLVVEDCVFFTPTLRDDRWVERAITVVPMVETPLAIVIRRNCVLGRIELNGMMERHAIRFHRNYVGGPPHAPVAISGYPGSLLLEENVIQTSFYGTNTHTSAISLQPKGGAAVSEHAPVSVTLVRNTIATPKAILNFVSWDTQSMCIATHNLFVCGKVAEQIEVDRALVSRENATLEVKIQENIEGMTSTDMSLDFTEPTGFRRVSATGQFPIRPTGALSPTIADEGDWFTRLQERWKVAITLRRDEPITPPAVPEATSNDSSDSTPQDSSRRSVTATLGSSQASVTDTLEPPPLDEWLQGREILTVKQDGTAMFTKIQDALDKAKPGQVVKILDRGPYRERLTKENFPDGGLISESSTIIEPSDYEQGELNSEPYLLAHRFQSSTGLRIAGIDFLFRESVQTRGVHSNSAITVEGCRFRFEKSPAKAENTGLFFGATGPAGWEVAAAIRDCEFRGGGLYSFNHDPQNPAQVIVVRSNLFSGDGSRAGRGIALSSSHKAFVCEQNVFTAGGQHCIVVASYGQPADGSRIRIANNLFMNARQSVVAAYWSAFAGVTFNRNLISGVSFYAADRAGQETEPFRDWRVSNNWFVSTEDEWTKGFLAADPSNRTGSLNFLSTDPSHRDYLRLPAASPAAQSDYLGPFPPGPAPPEGDWFTRLQERWK